MKKPLYTTTGEFRARTSKYARIDGSLQFRVRGGDFADILLLIRSHTVQSLSISQNAAEAFWNRVTSCVFRRIALAVDFGHSAVDDFTACSPMPFSFFIPVYTRIGLVD